MPVWKVPEMVPGRFRDISEQNRVGNSRNRKSRSTCSGATNSEPLPYAKRPRPESTDTEATPTATWAELQLYMNLFVCVQVFICSWTLFVPCENTSNHHLAPPPFYQRLFQIYFSKLNQEVSRSCQMDSFPEAFIRPPLNQLNVRFRLSCSKSRPLTDKTWKERKQCASRGRTFFLVWTSSGFVSECSHIFITFVF